MPMTTRNCLARVRSMIEVIRLSSGPALVERNRAMAEGYMLSLLDCGLIERVHYEQLTREAEQAVRDWQPGHGSLLDI